MTRGEITNSKSYKKTKEALKYYNEHYQDKDIDLTDAFEAGFDYADVISERELLQIVLKTTEKTKKEIISKACEWLQYELAVVTENIENIKEFHTIVARRYTDMSSFINDFKKDWNYEVLDC